MECHRCQWYQNAQLQGLPLESTPCGSCVLKMETPRRWAAGMVSSVPAEPGRHRLKPHEEYVPPERPAEFYPAAVVSEAIRILLHLPTEAFHVVQGRYLGLSAKETAMRHGYSRRKVESVLSRVVAANPVLAALFPRQLRRGPRAKDSG